jgi:3-oxoacyl-(acyl-carrier-protein) synthase
LPPEAVDILIMHAPGTVKGDQAELRAVQDVFGKKLPAMTSNKWKIGHTFGASGMLSIELALLMLRYQQFIPVPYADDKRRPEEINRVMVNAVGFGGNAVSMLLGRV